MGGTVDVIRDRTPASAREDAAPGQEEIGRVSTSPPSADEPQPEDDIVVELATRLAEKTTLEELAEHGALILRPHDRTAEASPIALSLLGVAAANSIDDILLALVPEDRTKLQAVLSVTQPPVRQEIVLRATARPERPLRLVLGLVPSTTGTGGFAATLTRLQTDPALSENSGFEIASDGSSGDDGTFDRAAFEQRLTEITAIPRTERQSTGIILVCLTGVDRAEDIAGREGVETIGRYAVRALAGTVRVDDGVYRLGDDQLAVLMSDFGDVWGLIHRAHKIATRLDATVRVGSGEVGLSAQVGVAADPDDTADDLDLYEAASIAAWQAGRELGTQVRAFLPAMRHSRNAAGSQENAVLDAIERGEFVPFFQPKINLETGMIEGFEALCRWQHPERGTLTPGAFYEALHSPVIGAQISDVSLVGSFDTAAKWRALGMNFGHVSINLSQQQLNRPSFVESVVNHCETRGIRSDQVVFEVLENVLIEDHSVVRRNLRLLHERGFAIALDDFGTGFASLTHVRDPYIREVKIDRSFVTKSGASASDQQIVSAIVQIASKLGLRVIAEGIEDEETLRKLRAVGCTIGQGFVFAPALPFEEATEFLGRQSRIHALLGAPGLT